MNLVPIDELIETWEKARKEVLAACADDSDLSWWREALQNLRPTHEDNEIP